MVKKILLALAAAFVLYTFYFLWAQAQPEPAVYNLVRPRVGDIEKTVTATGRLEPRTEVNIKPQVTGTVRSVEVKIGQQVKSGQLLATVQIMPDHNSISSAETAVNVAKVAFDNASHEFDRCRDLFDRKVISRRELEAAQTACLQAKERLQGSERLLEVARRGFDATSGNITEVRSSIDGTVMEIPSKVGTAVVSTNGFSEGTTVVVVGQMDDMVFRGTIDETDAAALCAGQPMHLVIGSMKDRTISGTLESVSPRGKSHNGTIQFDVVATVDVPAGVEVRAGYSANAEFVIDSSSDAIIIDEGCLEYQQGVPYVYCLTSDPAAEKKQTFDRVPVQLGVSDGIDVEVRAGVTEDRYLRGLRKQ